MDPFGVGDGHITKDLPQGVGRHVLDPWLPVNAVQKPLVKLAGVFLAPKAGFG